MTLTHVLPTLRQSLPDPLDRDRWPEFTSVTTSDVVIAGVSLVRLAEWCGTPCVHSAAAVIPGTGGRPSETELASAVLVSVAEVHRRPDGGLNVGLDGEFAAVAAETGQARLIGRTSTARDVMVHIRAAVLELPGDLSEGDLIAVPVRGAVRLHDVDPERRRLADPSGTAPESHCGR